MVESGVGSRESGVGFAWVSSAAITVALVLLLAASLMLMAARTYNPFIYFRF